MRVVVVIPVVVGTWLCIITRRNYVRGTSSSCLPLRLLLPIQRQQTKQLRASLPRFDWRRCRQVSFFFPLRSCCSSMFRIVYLLLDSSKRVFLLAETGRKWETTSASVYCRSRVNLGTLGTNGQKNGPETQSIKRKRQSERPERHLLCVYFLSVTVTAERLEEFTVFFSFCYTLCILLCIYLVNPFFFFTVKMNKTKWIGFQWCYKSSDPINAQPSLILQFDCCAKSWRIEAQGWMCERENTQSSTINTPTSTP